MTQEHSPNSSSRRGVANPSTSVGDPGGRARRAMRASVVAIAVSVVLAAVKLAAGIIGHSFALIADGVESTLDIVSASVVWGGLRIAATPPDENHPYGHGKAESMAALVVAVILLGVAVFLAIQSVAEIIAPHQAPAPFTLVVLVAVVITKEILFASMSRVSKSVDSTALRADAWHHRSDSLTSAAAFIGISLSLILGEGYESLDAWAALFACGIICFNGLKILRTAVSEAMDRAAPREIRARIREAALLAQTGKIDEALSKLQQLSEISQDNNSQVKVYLAQAEVLRAAHREQEAMTIYNNALKDSPENVDLLYARALTAEKLNMLDVTESDLRMVLVHEPDNANALNALGYTLADRTERLQEAREYILRAAALLPDDPAVLDSLGWVYYRLGEMEKAINWLRKAFAKLEDAEIAAHLGEVLWVDGQLEEAEKIWQRGLEVKADHPVLLDTIKRLKK